MELQEGLELPGMIFKWIFNIPGFGGYKYFGAAKDLPGVRELF